MICSKCGKDNTSTAKFCLACGTQLSHHTTIAERRVDSGKKPVIGKPVLVLIIIVGSLLALLIIAALVSNTPETAKPSNQSDRQIAVVETTEYDARGNLTKKTIESKIDYDKEAEEYFRQGKIDDAIITLAFSSVVFIAVEVEKFFKRKK